MTTPAAFAALETTRRVLDAARHRGRHLAVGGLWGASSALLCASLRGGLGRPLLLVTADDEDSDALAADLQTFGVAAPLILPRQDTDVDGELEPVSQGARARCLGELVTHDDAESGPFVLIASLESLLQEAPDVASLREGRVSLRSGMRADQDELVARCAEAGLRNVPLVLAPGEVSRRGDVLDVFPLASADAFRLEFFDDELESIRTFDPTTQRSLAIRDEVVLHLGGKSRGPKASGSTHVLPHVVRPDLLVGWHEPLRIDERRQVLTTQGGAEGRAALVQLQESLAPLAWIELSSLPSHDIDFKVLSAGSAVGSGESDPLGRLRAIRGLKGDLVEVVCRTEPERQRLAEIFEHRGVDLTRERLRLRVGALSRGFRVPDIGWTVLSNTEFAGVPAAARVVERPKIPSRAVQSFFELGPGDLVVHAVHGIALFEGLERVQRGAGEEEHLKLLFADDVRLLVPVSKIHLVQKYVGAGGATRPKLDKLGGKGFQRRKEEVQRSLFDLAADLLEVQAKREQARRDPYPHDALESEFLDGFPFEDTEDQRTCWAEIRGDLESDRPMDRLLCGDVGFGKTEVAMRAAFKVAITGRQVAILVPTTVLAEQHQRTFARRFAPHGLRVEVLSRFGTPRQRKQVVADTAEGKVDVLVGTHRLLSKDVAFARLGLLVIDEEQRFGVRQKEHVKTLRVGVDVLSLSATPIPRTLHASLLGVRQISTLSTPPPGRQDVETKVQWRDDAILQEALSRELGRGGQVYLLHDRIAGLKGLAETVTRLCPGAKVAIGHGQQTEAELEKTLRGFVGGDVDVLVCTSIVENGLDIPRANTILIDRAELFGLAELHQLRGRVGRSSEKAYCHLLMDRSFPPPEAARRRLKALEEFSHLGAGFAIAMKDLEIRGAGNLLGPQQSGHIAAVGYEMYCQLLRTAVDQAKATGHVQVPDVREVDVDLQVTAFLPDSFATEPKARLEILRELDGATSPAAAQAIRQDLMDRHGHLPASVETLLRVFLLKHLLMEQEVLGIQRTGPDRVVVRHERGRPLGGGWLDAFAEVRAVEAGKTHLILPKRRGRQQADWTPEATLQLLLESLSGADGLPKIGESCGSGSSAQKPRRRSSRPRS
ncbi:MAG: helicase-related protein [Planctomycetota bacterium]|nr:helicase-related protein [Planctomycetota bacterium]MDA1222090.1 helicase-related protein [Planctomycetota bacterium]